MKCSEIFKCYNIQMMKKNRLLSCFVMLSILFSVTISLAIPQVVIGLKEYWDEEAYLKNGAELKVECGFVSEAFNEKINQM